MMLARACPRIRKGRTEHETEIIFESATKDQTELKKYSRPSHFSEKQHEISTLYIEDVKDLSISYLTKYREENCRADLCTVLLKSEDYRLGIIPRLACSSVNAILTIFG